MRPRIKTMSSVGIGLIAAATMGAPAATATTTTAAQETPEGACKVLGDAGGDFTKIPGQPGMLCPNIYDPVTAIASGDYEGGQVIFRHTYSNRCDLARHTAPVFEL